MRQTIRRISVLGGILSLMALPLVFGYSVSANTYTSPNYKIDTSVVGGSISGPQSSTNYRMTSSGGESVIGQGTSGSYKLGEGYVATLEQSLQLTVQPNGLQAYYAFDEGIGTAVTDSTPNNNSGTFLNGATWTTGKVGSSASFDITDDTMSVPDSMSLRATPNLTVSLWFRASSLPTITGESWRLVRKGVSSTDRNYIINVNRTTNTIAAASSYSGINYSMNSGVVAVANTWYYVTYSIEGSIQRIYVNGALMDTQTRVETAVDTQNAPLVVSDNTAGKAAGEIDELKIYNRALSAEEIKAEYDAQNAGIAAGLSFASGVTPGVSKTSSFDAVTLTDAPGYTLAINQNNNLTSGGNTIAAISGSIASPLSWSEGTTKGLGFTLYGTNATAIAGNWNSGASYAALPNSGTTFYTRTGLSGGVKDYVNMRLRLDTPPSQVPGLYTNQMTITGTITP